MNRKTILLSLLVGVAVGGAAFYLLGTQSGKIEWKRLMKTGAVTADTFKTLGKEMKRNMDQARKEERSRALKAAVREALEA